MKNDLVEDIRERLTIEEVVSDYLDLKRSGRNLKALSPFSHEKTPSFIVSPEKQIWHDFSSGKGGTLFGFIMEMEGVDFKEALSILAQKAGLDISLYRYSSSRVDTNHKQAVLKALTMAAKFYQVQLLNNKSAISYVTKRRGFNKESVKDFCIGYAPNNWSAVSGYLQSKGVSPAVIQAAGLAGKTRQGRLYDNFRGRIMLPLLDPQGQVIGMTGRTVSDDDQAPKYINTPQTIVYDKSRHVFGYSQAKEAIRRATHVVIVEGNLDVVSSHQAGVKNVVATAGTAMTIQHLKIISRTVNDIRLAFDADNAGIQATERAIGLVQAVNPSQIGGIRLSVIHLPDGQDPDDLVRQDAQAWQATIAKPEYALDWLYKKYQQQLDITSAPGKREFTDIVLNVVGGLKDTVEREHYLRLLATDTNSSLEAIQDKLKLTQKDQLKPKKKPKASRAVVGESQLAKLEDRLLGLLMAYPETRQLQQKIDGDFRLSTPAKRDIHKYLLSSSGALSDESKLPTELKKHAEYVKLALFIATESYQSVSSNEKLREVVDLAKRLIRLTKMDKKNSLTAELQQAQEKGDEVAATKIIKELDVINKSLE